MKRAATSRARFLFPSVLSFQSSSLLLLLKRFSARRPHKPEHRERRLHNDPRRSAVRKSGLAEQAPTCDPLDWRAASRSLNIDAVSIESRREDSMRARPRRRGANPLPGHGCALMNIRSPYHLHRCDKSPTVAHHAVSWPPWQ